MESINFNDFSLNERYEIITAFLIKMRKANSMQSAHSFFEYYLKQFYKIPTKLLDDIIYCQRAMKTHLRVHEKINRLFPQQTDMELETKKNRMLEIEDILHEINAESQYLVLRLEEDIEQFCLPFTKQQLQPNGNLINEVVSEAVVPLICATLPPFKPNFVVERPTENELMRKYLAISSETTLKVKTNDEIAKPTRSAAPKRKPLVNAAQATAGQEVPAKPVLAVAGATRTTATGNGSGSGSASGKRIGPVAGSTVENKNEAVNASRLHLQAALKRARQNRNQIANCENKECSPKEMFLQSFGLCTLLKHKSIMQSRAMPQKKPSRNSRK